VMVVSGGYPGSYPKGKVITGTDEVKDAILFHAGTRLDENGELLTSGGRVIACSAYGNDIDDALTHSYAAADTVQFEGKYMRRDIGSDLKKLINA
ncbi:MAG: phosphoribosylamine--glycine ligase, partial [Duncaniella sp.]|nr:phosphoribosylamine--glycine ligase [Duncaniella sp.]